MDITKADGDQELSIFHADEGIHIELTEWTYHVDRSVCVIISHDNWQRIVKRIGAGDDVYVEISAGEIKNE